MNQVRIDGTGPYKTTYLDRQECFVCIAWVLFKEAGQELEVASRPTVAIESGLTFMYIVSLAL